MKIKARLDVQEIGGMPEEQEWRKAGDLSTGSELHLEDGASGKGEWKRKKVTAWKRKTWKQNVPEVLNVQVNESNKKI